MNAPAKITVLALLGLGGASCDFSTISSQAQARTVAVSTLLTTVPVQVSAAAVALPTVDGGTFDAGASFDGGFTIPAQSVVTVFFGQRQSDNLETAPVGTAGASVTLSEVGGGSWALSDLGSGTYALSSPDAGFVYQGGASYDFTMVLTGTTYVAEVSRVPQAETIARFHEAPGYIALAAGDAFSFTRPDPATGEDRQLGFVNVFPISSSGSQGEATYTNVPKTPLDFLKLVVAPSVWKQSVVTIPGTAFPESNHNYLIVFQSAKLGGPKSSNLFSGSAILAGTADLGIVKTNR